MQPMLDVAFFAPRWAVSRGSPGDRRNRWRPSAREFGRFAEAVARRYSGSFHDGGETLPAVRLFTTWNEPNHPIFLLPQWQRAGKRGRWRPVAPHLYRRMHEAAYDAIKRVNPADRVLIGGLAAQGSRAKGPEEGVPPLRFIRELACVDGHLRRLRVRECRGFRPLRADGFAIHPYTSNGPPGTSGAESDSLELADLGRLTDLLSELGRRGRIAAPLPVYVTEYGYETNPPDPRGVSLEQQADYVGQSTYLAWRRPDVDSVAQFLLQDIGPDPRQPVSSAHRWDDYQTGLLDYHGHSKPALQAFRLPFWVERTTGEGGVPGMFVFGQVRPGAGHRGVEIQAKAPGRNWHATVSLPLGTGVRTGCASFATDPYGFFVRFLPLAGPGSYRFVWARSAGRYEPSLPLQVEAGGARPLSELVRPAR
jgi:hypothetical protein